MKTYPTPRVHSFRVSVMTDAKLPRAGELVALVASHIPKFMDAGIRGFGWLLKDANNTSPAPGLPDKVTGFSGAFMVLNQGPEVVAPHMDALKAAVQENFPGQAAVDVSPVTSYDSWLAYYELRFDNTPTGTSNVLISRLLNREALEGDRTALAEALTKAIVSDGSLGFLMLGGKGVIDAAPRGGSNSVNPGWRRTYVHAGRSTSFPYRISPAASVEGRRGPPFADRKSSGEWSASPVQQDVGARGRADS